MPATTSELTEKNNFRGNILERNYPVHFNAKTGAYSYNYADLSPELASELEKVQYFRVSSPTLAEIEVELAKHLKKEEPAPPPVKGEITKASEEVAKRFEEATNVAIPLIEKKRSGVPLTENEKKALAKTKENIRPNIYTKKMAEAKKIYNSIQSLANEKGVNINALKAKAATNVLSAEEQEVKDRLPQLTQMESIIDAYEVLEILEEKVKGGEELTMDDLFDKDEAERILKTATLEVLRAPLTSVEETVSLASEKQKYNNARALITQIEGTPENKRSAKQLKNLSNAKAIVRDYEGANPKAFEAAVEKEANIFMAESKKYQNKRNAAEKVVRELTAKKNLTANEQAKKAKSQSIVNAYVTYTNPFATPEEKAAAEKTLTNAPNSNNTPSLEGMFNGGKRKTRRRKSSKKKTHKRKH